MAATWQGLRTAVVCTVLAAAVLAACTSESADRSGEAVALAPPGTPLLDGHRVPPGAVLVGPVFPTPYPEQTPGQLELWRALLLVTGGPLEAWDAFATKARELEIPLPGSADSCEWLSEMQSIPEDRAITSDPPGDASAVRCEAWAWAGEEAVDRRFPQLSASLWWGGAGSHLAIEFSRADGDFASTGPAQAGGAVGAVPTDSFNAATDVRLAALPHPRSEPDLPDVGEPFGRENNCFQRGYDRFDTPPGARLIAPASPSLLGQDSLAVLAVADARSVLTDLGAQLVRGTDEPAPKPSRRRLSGGGVIWELDYGAAEGGGACAMWSGPDGGAVMVTSQSD